MTDIAELDTLFDKWTSKISEVIRNKPITFIKEGKVITLIDVDVKNMKGITVNHRKMPISSYDLEKMYNVIT